MKTPVKALIAVTTLVALSGCVAVPVEPGYYEPAVVYVPPPAYYGPRVWYGPPAYYGPSIRFGIYGGSNRHYHRGPRGGRHR
jgi:hypothetical protein